MASKKWQRSQNTIAHIGLILFGVIPFSLLQTSYSSRIKFVVIGLAYLILIPLIRFLHRRLSNTFIKVVTCDFEMAGRIIQRSLNTANIPFTKQSDDAQIVFQFRQGTIKLEVDEFPLNMMYDSHLTTKIATKLTLHPETADNRELMHRIRTTLDTAFVSVMEAAPSS